jgi:hypothetical protein
MALGDCLEGANRAAAGRRSSLQMRDYRPAQPVKRAGFVNNLKKLDTQVLTFLSVGIRYK